MSRKGVVLLSVLAFLVLGLGLALISVRAPEPAIRPAGADRQATQEPERKLSPRAAGKPADRPDPADHAAQVDMVAKTKLAEREKGLSIRDLRKHGIFVEAEQVGKNSASGKVRVTAPGGAVLEADRAKMSSNGMLVAEGNPVMVKGELRANMGGENGAMAIYFDEGKQGVVMRAGAADRITDESRDESNVTDPDRENLGPAPEE